MMVVLLMVVVVAAAEFVMEQEPTFAHFYHFCTDCGRGSVD
jgi:hypothetical protein